MASIQIKFDDLFVIKQEVKPEKAMAKKKRRTAQTATRKSTGNLAAKKPAKSEKRKPTVKKKTG
jgi:hypothetical protein